MADIGYFNHQFLKRTQIKTKNPTIILIHEQKTVANSIGDDFIPKKEPRILQNILKNRIL